MDKTISSLAEAVSGIPDGAVAMIDGFGGSGAPIELIDGLIERGMAQKLICSFPRSADPKVFTSKYLAGEIELELVPQGTLAARKSVGSGRSSRWCSRASISGRA